MKRTMLLVLLAGLLAADAASQAWAQKPLTGDLVLAAHPPSAEWEWTAGTVCDRNGACAVVWEAPKARVPPTRPADALAAVLSADGSLLTPPRTILRSTNGFLGDAFVGLDEGFAMLFGDAWYYTVGLQRFDEKLEPRGDSITIPTTALTTATALFRGIAGLAQTPDGLAVLTLISTNRKSPNALALSLISETGAVTHSAVELAVAGDQGIGIGPNPVAAQPNGDLVVVFAGDLSCPGVCLQRVSPRGEVLGPKRRVSNMRGLQDSPGIAVARDGSFLVIWARAPQPDAASDLYGQRFSPQGHPLGDTFRVAQSYDGGQALPALTVDSHGHYVIVWVKVNRFGGDVKGRWFDTDGTPLTPEMPVNQMRLGNQEYPAVAASSQGTVVVSWVSDAPAQRGDEEWVPVARVFGIPPKSRSHRPD